MSFRLPQNYIPSHYDLYLHINDKFPLKASVSITFQKNKDDNKILLNVESPISISKITQNAIDLNYTVDYPLLTIERSKVPDIDFNSYPITIEYTVLPSDHFEQGFFLQNGSYLTDFEPNHARKFLPCFDEPSVRSTFSVKLLFPSNMTALSNMPAEAVQSRGDETEITFQKTPPMCTYLLCICVGTFSSIVGTTDNGLKVKFFTNSGRETDLKPSLDAAIYAVNWLETKFGVKFELPELQLIALESFPGGMENYGLITLRDITDSLNQRLNTFLIFHEIVHQWFGNLVSIEYWNSLWLNEGFAEFIQYLIMKDYKPKYDIFVLFAQNEGTRSFDYVDDENEIAPLDENVILQSLFNANIYAKGSFVVKMLYDLVGETLFYKICSDYLKKFKNRSAVVEDFISIASSLCEKDMNPFFEPWLRLPGLPVLNVTEIECNSQKVGIEINQISRNESSYLFKVPILYEKDGVISKKVVEMDSSEVQVDIEFDWVIVNDDLASICLVLYSKKLLEALEKPNNEKKISSLNKYVISTSANSKIASFFVDVELMDIINSLTEKY